MPSTTMIDFFETVKDAEEMLEAAESSARSKFDTQFVDDLTRRFDTYGLKTYLSEAQYEQLKRISEL